MKFFQKRAVAAVVLILAIVAGVVIGQAKKPDTGRPGVHRHCGVLYVCI